MMLRQIVDATELATLKPAAGLPGLDADELTGNSPDAHWVVTDGDSLLARCSLWWRDAPKFVDKIVGVIGHYAALDNETSKLLLTHSCEQLRRRNCKFAIGPMDGSTWHRYRMVTEAGDEPPFFLEPYTPCEWPQQWQAAGFEPIAQYSTRINTDLNYEDPRLMHVAARMDEQGISIRNLNIDDFESELRRIHQVSCISFRSNFLYTPIPEDEFVALYDRFQPYLKPEWVFLAMCRGELVGFLFAIPDWLQAQRGLAIDTVVVKSLAVLPGRANAGLGNLLAMHCHRAAREIGYTRAIHALMHDGNHSRNVSSRYAHIMRRYALFGRDL